MLKSYLTILLVAFSFTFFAQEGPSNQVRDRLDHVENNEGDRKILVLHRGEKKIIKLSTLRHHLAHGDKVLCRRGFEFSPGHFKCVPICRDGYRYDAIKDDCVPRCRADLGYIWDKELRKCVKDPCFQADSDIRIEAIQPEGRNILCVDQSFGTDLSPARVFHLTHFVLPDFQVNVNGQKVYLKRLIPGVLENLHKADGRLGYVNFEGHGHGFFPNKNYCIPNVCFEILGQDVSLSGVYLYKVRFDFRVKFRDPCGRDVSKKLTYYTVLGVKFGNGTDVAGSSGF